MKSFELNKQILEIKEILLEIKKKLMEYFKERFKDLIIYGSYARGEARKESDVDLLLILKGPVNTFQEIDNIGEIVYDLSLHYGYLFSIIPISENDYKNQQTSFIDFIKKEGLSI